MTRHSRRASPALRALNEADPALAALSLWCEHRDAEQGPNGTTRGSTILYGPGFDTLPRHEQMGLAAHHILHVALRHTARMRAMELRFGDAFDPAVYAIAADAIVNEALLAAGHALPRPALVLTGLLQEVTGQRATPAEALAEWDADSLYIRLMQDGPGNGGSADRAKRHVETKVFEPDLEPEEARGAPAEAEEAALWRQHLARALEAGQMAGRGIGTLGHRLADIPAGTTPWEVVLRALVSRAVLPQPRQSYRRPARAWIAMDAAARAEGGRDPAFQPGTRRETDVPKVVLCLDCSSSVDEARLAMFMGEIAGAVRRSAAELHVIPFDEVPQPPVRLDPARWQAQMRALDLPRGGGTDFGPVLAAGAALRPSLLVVLTDLDGDFGEDPRLPVLWAVPDAIEPAVPPFGRVLSLAR